ncbi:MAG TPA: hypothetical protein VHW66_19210 [Stellaceae bacterium]|jgi:hypothetical protein|nr:hypothetical protein [Stellaceae bacterium]
MADLTPGQVRALRNACVSGYGARIETEIGLGLQKLGLGSLYYIWYSDQQFTFIANAAGRSALAESADA